MKEHGQERFESRPSFVSRIAPIRRVLASRQPLSVLSACAALAVPIQAAESPPCLNDVCIGNDVAVLITKAKLKGATSASDKPKMASGSAMGAQKVILDDGRIAYVSRFGASVDTARFLQTLKGVCDPITVKLQNGEWSYDITNQPSERRQRFVVTAVVRSLPFGVPQSERMQLVEALRKRYGENFDANTFSTRPVRSWLHDVTRPGGYGLFAPFEMRSHEPARRASLAALPECATTLRID